MSEPVPQLTPLRFPTSITSGFELHPWTDDLLVAGLLLAMVVLTRIASGIGARRSRATAAAAATETLDTVLSILGPYGARRGTVRWNARSRRIEVTVFFPEISVGIVGKLGMDPASAAWGILAHRPEAAGFGDPLSEEEAPPPAGNEGERERKWWDVLGVPSSADEREVSMAYRSKARLAHPDAGGSDALMAELNAARDQWRQRKD